MPPIPEQNGVGGGGEKYIYLKNGVEAHGLDQQMAVLLIHACRITSSAQLKPELPAESRCG